MPRGVISDPPASPGLIWDFHDRSFYKFWPGAGEEYRKGQIVDFDYPLEPGDAGYDHNNPAHRFGAGFARNVR